MTRLLKQNLVLVLVLVLLLDQLVLRMVLLLLPDQENKVQKKKHILPHLPLPLLLLLLLLALALALVLVLLLVHQLAHHLDLNSLMVPIKLLNQTHHLKLKNHIPQKQKKQL